METVPVDVFRQIFTWLPRAFKYRRVCQEWKHRLSERMFIYLWEKQWIKSGDHLQWLEFDEPILQRGWFGKINIIGMKYHILPYNGYHFGLLGGCNYYVFGRLVHTFGTSGMCISIKNTYFHIDWDNKELILNRPEIYENGFHVTKNQSWQRITESGKRSKLNQCSKKQHANFLRIYNSGIFQRLIQAYISHSQTI